MIIMAMPFKVNLLDNLSAAILNERQTGKVIEVDMDRIYPNPNQPRRVFDEEELNELAKSIRTNGLLQPIIVRRIDIGYELVAGERRLRAARLCGMTEIACIIIETSERGSALMSIVENTQRSGLNYFEEAEAISNLISFFGFTQEEVAVRLGKNQSTVANKLRLLKLPREERRLYLTYGLTERHVRALLRIESSDIRKKLAEEIVTKKLNVDNTEKLVERELKKDKEMTRIRRCKGAFKDVRIFVNTINHAVEVMQAAGINAEVRKNKEREYTEYVVRIPNSSQSDNTGASA